MKNSKTLPEKPSELIRVAIKDLIKCEKSPKYYIDMGEWHTPYGYLGKCTVCLAGSVMAKTFDKNLKAVIFPESFDSSTENKLVAIDNLRAGDLHSAFLNLNIEYNCELFGVSEFEGIDMIQYHANPTLFKKDMLGLADYLEFVGH